MTTGRATPAEAVELMERVRARRLLAQNHTERTMLPSDRDGQQKASQTLVRDSLAERKLSARP